MSAEGDRRPNLLGLPNVNGQPSVRLESWKEIASYLMRSERTVRRWEETEELPVHRQLHEKRQRLRLRCRIRRVAAIPSSAHSGLNERIGLIASTENRVQLDWLILDS